VETFLELDDSRVKHPFCNSMQQQANSSAVVDIVDVPNLSLFGTFCGRSLQSEDVVVMGSPSAQMSRIVMAGLESTSTTSASVISVIESKIGQQGHSEFAIKTNQGSGGLGVSHSTLRLDSSGNFEINDSNSVALLVVESSTQTLQTPNVHILGTLCVGTINLIDELQAAKQDIADLKAALLQLQNLVLPQT
jgi:hypothetical protein